MIGHLGIYHDVKRGAVTLRPRATFDFRDYHLRARWDRLVRRWMRQP